MNIYRNLSKRLLILLILFFALFSFLIGLIAVFTFQSRYLLSDRIERAVTEANRLVSFDNSITLERALKLYSNNLSYAVFDQDCNPIYVTDLLIHPKACQIKHENFYWKEIQTQDEKKLYFAFSSQFNIEAYLIEYRVILFSTIGIYLICIFILIFIFIRLFIEDPINKISITINELLLTKHFNLNNFEGKNNNLLSNLYSAISRLIEEIVRFKREEEKLFLSRQIAHDLRAPLSILENQLKENTEDRSIEKLALKRLLDITDGLMPDTQKILKQDFNLNELFSEIVLIYPNISFNLNSSTIEEKLMTLKISEIELFRFLTNLIKNSVEAGARNIEIEAKMTNDIFEISLKDDGRGSKTEITPQILAGHTTKSDGHGLGISAINSKLKSLGGELRIITSPQDGFKAIMNVPLKSMNRITYVLIDDDKLIRLGWTHQAQKNGIKLKCFENIDQFFENQINIPSDSHIYIDSNLKNGVRGELECKKIADRGYPNIYLSTGYSKENFDLTILPWIKGVVSKTTPF